MKNIFKRSVPNKRSMFDEAFNVEDYPVSEEYLEKFKDNFAFSMEVLGIESPDGYISCMCGQCKAPVYLRDLHDLIQKGEWADYDQYLNINLEMTQRMAYVDETTVEERIDKEIRRSLQFTAKTHPELFKEYNHESLHLAFI